MSSGMSAHSTGRVVLITGCSSGIGRETALYLARRGWRVFASARQLQDILDFEAADISLVQLDVTDEKSRCHAIENVLQAAGRLDALVNNAGVNIGGPLELISLEDAYKQFDTNVWGGLRLIQLVVPIMREQGGGRLINIGSVMGRVALPFSGLYAASKHALEALSDTLRWELVPWNIHVSLVQPGLFRAAIGGKSKVFRSRFADDPFYARYLGGGKGAGAVRKPPRFSVTRLVRHVLGGKHPVGVARTVERALTDPRPSARYPAGLDARLYLFIRWLVPDPIFDYGVRRFYGFAAPASAPGSGPMPRSATRMAPGDENR